MAGFNTPGLLFVGASGRGEIAYAGPLLSRLWDTGDYDTYVEPCVGGFSMAQIAQRSGWPTAGFDTSDVTLFSSVLGYWLADRPMADLDVHVDGHPVDLTGTEQQQAARILAEQLRMRLEAKPDHVYWQELERDLVLRRDEHEAAIAARLDILRERLGTVAYRSAGLIEHIADRLDDPRALIHAVPPTFTAGYEKWFDTDGRLQWDEPAYALFDPDDGWADLWEATRDAAATFVGMRECAPGTRFWPDGAVYANQQRIDQYGYYVTNRTDKVLDLMGGRKVRVARPGSNVRPLPHPMIPADHEITPDSTIRVQPIDAGHARHYKSLWMHGTIGLDNAEGNFAVLVDGYVAGIGAVNASPINRPNPGFLSANRGDTNPLLLVYATGCPHPTYRLTRLATQVALQRPIVEPIVSATESGAMAMVVADRVWTIEKSKYPEAKGMRGLMKLRNRKAGGQQHATSSKRAPKRAQPNVGGYDLLYEAPLDMLTPTEVLDQWLTKEHQWRKARASSSAQTSKSGS